MFNTLDSYGDSQGAFLTEGELAQSTDSSYKRHAIGGNNNGKEDSKDADGIVRISKD